MRAHAGTVRGHYQARRYQLPATIAKSTVANVLWPAWQWCRDGGRSRGLFCTCTEELAVRDSVRRRSLIQSEWYQRLVGDLFQLSLDMNLKHHYVTNHHGEMYSTYVGGAMGTVPTSSMTRTVMRWRTCYESPKYSAEDELPLKQPLYETGYFHLCSSSPRLVVGGLEDQHPVWMP
jgi:hypothetical protein